TGAVEICSKRHVDGRRLSSVQVDLHVSLAGSGGPDPPDTSRPFQLSQDTFARARVGQRMVAVGIGTPFDVKIVCRIISAATVIARRLRTALTRLGQTGQILQIDHSPKKVTVGQGFGMTDRGLTNRSNER